MQDQLLFTIVQFFFFFQNQLYGLKEHLKNILQANVEFSTSISS